MGHREEAKLAVGAALVVIMMGGCQQPGPDKFEMAKAAELEALRARLEEARWSRDFLDIGEEWPKRSAGEDSTEPPYLTEEEVWAEVNQKLRARSLERNLMPDEPFPWATAFEQIRIGMTKDQLTAIVGHPERVHRTVTSLGTSEQWVYPQSRYVYLYNGIVTSYQD